MSPKLLNLKISARPDISTYMYLRILNVRRLQITYFRWTNTSEEYSNFLLYPGNKHPKYLKQYVVYSKIITYVGTYDEDFQNICRRVESILLDLSLKINSHDKELSSSFLHMIFLHPLLGTFCL